MSYSAYVSSLMFGKMRKENSSDQKDKGKFRILVVDDNIAIVEVVRAVLSHRGIEVDVAFDGKEALEKYRIEPHDLIIMDCQMPVMDGYDATKSIRNMSSTESQVPILAFTINDFDEVREKCLASGMNDFIAKPISQDSLAKIIAKYNSRKVFSE